MMKNLEWQKLEQHGKGVFNNNVFFIFVQIACFIHRHPSHYLLEFKLNPLFPKCELSHPSIKSINEVLLLPRIQERNSKIDREDFIVAHHWRNKLQKLFVANHAGNNQIPTLPHGFVSWWRFKLMSFEYYQTMQNAPLGMYQVFTASGTLTLTGWMQSLDLQTL